MRRGVFDVLRRGLDNAIANWPLLLVRFFEVMIYGVITVVAIVAALVPVVVSLGFKLAELRSPADIAPLMTALFTRWTLLIYLVGLVFALVTIFSVAHAFVEAGCARVYVDGDRLAGPAMTGPKSRYRAFSMSLWWAGARDGGWPVFWMYVIAWAGACAIFLIPLIPTLVGMLLLRGKPAPTAIVGCLGLLITFLLMIPVGIVVSIWTNRAIATWAVIRGGARDTLRVAWAAFKADLGRHLLVALVLFVVSFAGSMFIGSLTFAAGFAEALGRNNSGSIALMMLPLRFLAQILSTAFSAVVGGWFLSSFCALANESPSRQVSEPDDVLRAIPLP